MRTRSKPSTTTPSSSHGNGHTFGVRTRIARASGKPGRYASDAVRVLPAPDGEHAILQATDGRQAVCLFGPGVMADARLVPQQVLPTRRLNDFARVQLVNGAWQSTEGKLATDSYGEGEGAFPPVGEVLPKVGKTPAHETAAHAARRRRSADQPASEHVMLGIDLELLKKQAEALGTTKLMLMVPIPIRAQGARSAETGVNRPVPVMAATEEGVDGVGLVMPLRPGKPFARYEQLRQAIVDAERHAKPTNGGNGHAAK